MRRIFLNISLMLMFITPLLYADVDAQIEAIKSASVKERFKLMNAFKKNLLNMKEQERINALKKLSKKSNSKNAKMALKELKEVSKRNKMKKHLEYDYIDEDSFLDDQEGNDYD